MKRLICFLIAIMMTINIAYMTVRASEVGSESKSLEEADTLVRDNNGKDYYRQFMSFDEPVFIIIAKEYLDNEPQFYLTNAWSDILNKEYRSKGAFKNEYIYDMIIMGFLKYEITSGTYSDSLLNRTQDFATDLYSVLDNELDDVFDKSKISDSTMEFYHNNQTISDLGLAMSVVDYAAESYEIYLDVMASKMALLESNRDKLALFSASVNAASAIEDNDYSSAMNLIIDAMDTADPTGYLNKKTDMECSSFLLGVVEDVVKETNPIFQLLDLSVSGIDLVFNSSENASNDIKLAYFYLADSYLRQGLISILEKYINPSDPSNKTSENAREFIDSFKTYLLFLKFGNLYADEWLDNYIEVRSTPIKKLFNKKNIQNALYMKEQCKTENDRIDKMLESINALEKEEDTWKIILGKKDNENEVVEATEQVEETVEQPVEPEESSNGNVYVLSAIKNEGYEMFQSEIVKLKGRIVRADCNSPYPGLCLSDEISNDFVLNYIPSDSIDSDNSIRVYSVICPWGVILDTPIVVLQGGKTISINELGIKPLLETQVEGEYPNFNENKEYYLTGRIEDIYDFILAGHGFEEEPDALEKNENHIILHDRLLNEEGEFWKSSFDEYFPFGKYCIDLTVMPDLIG